MMLLLLLGSSMEDIIPEDDNNEFAAIIMNSHQLNEPEQRSIICETQVQDIVMNLSPILLCILYRQ